MAPIIYTQRLQYPLVEEYTLNHTRRIKGYWSLLVLLYCYLDPLGLERSSPLGPTLREENNEDPDKARDRWDAKSSSHCCKDTEFGRFFRGCYVESVIRLLS